MKDYNKLYPYKEYKWAWDEEECRLYIPSFVVEEPDYDWAIYDYFHKGPTYDWIEYRLNHMYDYRYDEPLFEATDYYVPRRYDMAGCENPMGKRYWQTYTEKLMERQQNKERNWYMYCFNHEED